MPLNIRDEDTNRLAERLAGQMRSTKTAAVKQALRNELERIERQAPLRERLRRLRDRVISRAPTGLEAGKAFYDSLSGHCFAYAMSKNHGVPLLFKGDDFGQTDIADGR